MRRLMFLVLLAGGLFILLRPLSGSFGSAPLLRAPAMLNRAGAMNILVLGLDRRATEVPRSDTIVVVHVGPGTAPTLLSIPRDLWVPIPTHGDDRINTAYTWGELNGGQGAALARRTVEQNFGVAIDRVVVIDFACFQQAVDAAGGITVQIDQQLFDPTHPLTGGQATPLTFEAGPRKLNGEEALQFARLRAPDSDFGRIRRQHQVLEALGERARDPQVALRVARMVMRQCPTSGLDLTPADLVTLSSLASRSGDPRIRLIDESMVNPTTLPSGAQVLLPRWELIRPLAADLLTN